jgi:aerobic carbon-monoxide dehydrogenase small subunit
LFQGRKPGKIDPILTPSVAGNARRREKSDLLARFLEEEPMTAVALTVNGKAVTGDIDPRTLLVQYLREHLRLTGTHVGCDTSQCGACVVHVNGKAVKSCTIFPWQIEGANVLTIEGLADPTGPLHPMQEAFREHHGLQCGYCTPGMIMTAVDMVHRKGNDLDDHTIRHELEGNLCRCTGYHNIVKAIAAGAKAMAKGHAHHKP